ncbi:MAG: type II CAAX endopeptidase family protein [Acidobacteriota bacterium]
MSAEFHNEENARKPPVFLVRVWRRLPVIVQAVLTASLVSLLGSSVWSTVAYLNILHSPSIPWSVAGMAGYLWLYWQYLQGRWWPRGTAETRRRNLRAVSLPRQTWRWALLAGGSAIGATTALMLVLARFFPTGNSLPDFALRLPPHTLLPLILMSSTVAGIAEEASFRGYLQAPIERRHGPVAAILISSALFSIAHLPGGRSITPASYVLFALYGVNYGILAHVTRSILPGVVLHASGNVAGFALLWWLGASAGETQWRAVAVTEALKDRLFLANCAEVILLAAVALWAYRKLCVTMRGQTSNTM